MLNIIQTNYEIKDMLETQKLDNIIIFHNKTYYSLYV